MSISTRVAIVVGLAALSHASPVVRRQPIASGSAVPSGVASGIPSAAASVAPSAAPSTVPSAVPSAVPSGHPSAAPSAAPSGYPSAAPSDIPSETTATETTTPAPEPSTDWCANADLGSVEGAAGVWNDRGVGKYLDEYLVANGESNWLNNLASATLQGSGDAGSFGCGNRDQSCLNGLPTCATLAGADHGAEYWIFNAAQKLQDTFERAHENLQDSVIDSALTVSSIASDFEVDFKTDPEILTYFAAAFGIAAGISYGSGAVVDGVKTIATLFSGIIGQLPDSEETVDPTQSMDSTLKDIFSTQRTILDETLSLAVGGDGDYSTLPDQAGDYTTSVAKFMADGKFLLQGNLVNDYFSAGYDALNKKLVDIALQEYGYRILRDENFDDPDSCATQHGAFWMDLAGGRCMRLTYQDGENTFWPVPDDIPNKMQDNYGINVFDYFTAACDCAINGSGEPDLSNLPSDGTPPQCFYNIACQDAEVCLESNDVDWSICWPMDFD